MIEAVWATPPSREEFSASERQGCIDDYAEHGPQCFAGGAGFAFYRFTDGRTLVLADNSGKVSVMTEQELEEARKA